MVIESEAIESLAAQGADAMAVLGKNRHYRWEEIQVRHWLETGRRCALPRGGRRILEEIVERVPGAVEVVRSSLPRTFRRP